MFFVCVFDPGGRIFEKSFCHREVEITYTKNTKIPNIGFLRFLRACFDPGESIFETSFFEAVENSI